MEEKKDKLHSILKKNKNNLLSPNGSIIIVIFTIKSEIKQYLK